MEAVQSGQASIFSFICQVVGGLLPVATNIEKGLSPSGVNLKFGGIGVPQWYLVLKVQDDANSIIGLLCTYVNTDPVYININARHFDKQESIKMWANGTVNTTYTPNIKYKKDSNKNTLEVWIQSGSFYLNYLKSSDDFPIKQEPPSDAITLSPQ